MYNAPYTRNTPQHTPPQKEEPMKRMLVVFCLAELSAAAILLCIVSLLMLATPTSATAQIEFSELSVKVE